MLKIAHIKFSPNGDCMSIEYRIMSKNTIFLLIFILINLIFIDISWADVPANVLNRTADDFKVAMASWDKSVRNAATYLFYSLLTIAMVWRFSMMAIKGGLENPLRSFIKTNSTF